MDDDDSGRENEDHNDNSGAVEDGDGEVERLLTAGNAAADNATAAGQRFIDRERVRRLSEEGALRTLRRHYLNAFFRTHRIDSQSSGDGSGDGGSTGGGDGGGDGGSGSESATERGKQGKRRTRAGNPAGGGGYPRYHFTFDKTPAYFDRADPETIVATLPGVRLVAMLREPGPVEGERTMGMLCRFPPPVSQHPPSICIVRLPRTRVSDPHPTHGVSTGRDCTRRTSIASGSASSTPTLPPPRSAFGRSAPPSASHAVAALRPRYVQRRQPAAM